MKIRQLIVHWTLLGGLGLHAAAAGAIDLVGAYQHALRHDPAQLAADEAVTAGREIAVQGDALLRPRIALQAGVSYLDDRSSGTLPPALAATIPSDSNGTVRQAAVQLVQPLYDAAARAGKQQARQQTALAETQYDQARQRLAQRVAEVYFGVLLAKETMRVVEAEKTAIGRQRDRARARFDVGRGKVTDLQEAQARYDQVLTKEISARSALQLRHAQFQEAIGLPAKGLAPLAAGFAPSAPQPESLAVWQTRGEEHSTLVRVRRSQLEIATAEIGKHKLGGRPTLDLVARYSAGGQSGGLSPLAASDNHRSAMLGVQVNVPLYAGGAIDSRERESSARQRQAEQELSAAQRDVRLQVQDAYLSVETNVSRIASLQQALLSARTALEATTLGRDVGTRTELDVLAAQQQAFTAELDLTQARFDYLLGRIGLAAAAGELGEGDLHVLNGWLAVR